MKASGPVCRIAFFALLLVDAALSLQPRASVDAMYSPEIQSWDLAVHAALYAALAALACGGFVRRGPGSWRGRLAVWILLAGLGAVLELLQTLPAVGRSCSLSDVLSNAAGALAGALLAPARRT